MRIRIALACGVLLAAVAPSQQAAAAVGKDAEFRPIDFAAVDRTIGKLPPLGAEARYGLFLFGDHAEIRVWAVLDRSGPGATYDILYLDRDGNGDLTGPGERIVGKPKGSGAGADCEFAIGEFRPPGSEATHREFRITWTRKLGVRYRMLWRGEKATFGGYGPSNDTYAEFGDSPRTAPVLVPGWDRPLEFERWIADPLRRGRDTDVKVFVGNRGDRTGAFTAVDDKFLPEGEYVVATLRYRDRAGKPQTARFELKQRC